MLKERSAEELLGILQTFPEAFKDRFGRKITKQEILKHLNDRLQNEELKQLRTQFDNFTPLALKAAIKTIENGSFDNIDDGFKAKPPEERTNESISIAQDLMPKDDTEVNKHKKNKKLWKDIF